MSPKSQFLTEILEQPAALSRLLSEGREPTERAAAKIKEFGPEWALIAARGSSDNAARYAQYLLGAHNGLGVGLAVPSLISLYGAKVPIFKRAKRVTYVIGQDGKIEHVEEGAEAVDPTGAIQACSIR